MTRNNWECGPRPPKMAKEEIEPAPDRIKRFLAKYAETPEKIGPIKKRMRYFAASRKTSATRAITLDAHETKAGFPMTLFLGQEYEA